MRVNIYEEELTDDVQIVETTADTGRTFYGVRCYLDSSTRLHHTEEDDDRSAVTFWIGTIENATILRDAIQRSMKPYVARTHG